MVVVVPAEYLRLDDPTRRQLNAALTRATQLLIALHRRPLHPVFHGLVVRDVDQRVTRTALAPLATIRTGQPLGV